MKMESTPVKGFIMTVFTSIKKKKKKGLKLWSIERSALFMLNAVTRLKLSKKKMASKTEANNIWLNK